MLFVEGRGLLFQIHVNMLNGKWQPRFNHLFREIKPIFRNVMLKFKFCTTKYVS